MIEYKIPHFLFGVSKQAENRKQPGTVNEQINGYSDISEGLKKRRGMYFEGAFNLANPSEVYKVHWIKSTDQTFVVFLCNNATTPLQIFKLSDPTTAMTINYDLTATEGADYTANKKNYLTKDAKSAGSSISVLEDLRVMSIFDSTFIVNRKMVCALTGTADGSTSNAPSNGVYGDSNDGTYGITSNTNVYPSYNDLPMQVPTGSNDNVNAVNVTSGDYYKTLQSTVNRPAGVYKVTATSTSGSEAANTALFELQITDYNNSLIDYETMPLQLIYNESTDDFDVKYPEWSHRYTGDDITNPGPSFIGRTIDDLVFHQGRLWICADEFIVSSRRGNYFNFWPYDIGTQIPSDPIDETIADEGLNKILYAVPYRSLVLFTEGGRQFEVRSTGGMAPDTVSIIPTTSYFVSPELRPTFLGNNLYFLSDFENYGQLYEYYYLDNAASNIAASVTDHTPNYLPNSLSLVSGDINNGIMLFSNRNTREVYCYVSRWQGDEKVINSISKWRFPDTGFLVESHNHVDNSFYFVMKNSSNVWIVTSLDTVNKNKLGNIPYEESLDYLERFESGGSYDSGTNRTTFTMSIDLNHAVTESQIRVLVENRSGWTGFSLEVLDVDTSGGVTTITVNGDWTSYNIAIGLVFDFEVQLNYTYIKDQDNTTVTGNFTMKQFVLFVKDTIQYSVEVDTVGRSTPFSYDYSVVRLDASGQVWDEIPLSETQRTQNIVYGQGSSSRIKVKDTSEYPITLVEGQIRGVFSKTLGNK